MYWLLYDISDNRRRLKVARICKDCGLSRVQKSCFFGSLDKAVMEKLEQEVEKVVDPDDIIYIIPITEAILKKIRVWGTPLQEENFKENSICFI